MRFLHGPRVGSGDKTAASLLVVVYSGWWMHPRVTWELERLPFTGAVLFWYIYISEYQKGYFIALCILFIVILHTEVENWGRSDNCVCQRNNMAVVPQSHALMHINITGDPLEKKKGPVAQVTEGNLWSELCHY